MFPVSKILLRGAVVGALGLGAALVIAGPDRIGSLFTQARSSINDTIDKNITDPVALRAQLKSLAAQYPKRIGEVRGDLAQLKEQQAQLNRDLAVSNRVVSLADNDLDKLATAISHAETAQIQAASFSPAADGSMVDHKVVIVFKGEKIEIDQAQVKSNQITATRNAYAQRAADIQRDLGYLAQQERQMSQLLTKLEAEHTSFQTQMFDLDRQIDSIARNDRMIEIIKDRQDTLNDQSRYRARQEATLESLARAADHFSYEDAAKAQIDRESSVDPSGARSFAPARSAPRTEPTIIEINPDKLPKVEKDGPVAAR